MTKDNVLKLAADALMKVASELASDAEITKQADVQVSKYAPGDPSRFRDDLKYGVLDIEGFHGLPEVETIMELVTYPGWKDVFSRETVQEARKWLAEYEDLSGPRGSGTVNDDWSSLDYYVNALGLKKEIIDDIDFYNEQQFGENDRLNLDGNSYRDLKYQASVKTADDDEEEMAFSDPSNKNFKRLPSTEKSRIKIDETRMRKIPRVSEAADIGKKILMAMAEEVLASWYDMQTEMGKDIYRLNTAFWNANIPADDPDMMKSALAGLRKCLREESQGISKLDKQNLVNTIYNIKVLLHEYAGGEHPDDQDDTHEKSY